MYDSAQSLPKTNTQQPDVISRVFRATVGMTEGNTCTQTVVSRESNGGL